MSLKTVLLTVLGAAALAAGVALAYVSGQSEEAGEAQAPPPPLVEIARPEPVGRPPALNTTGFIRAADRLAVTAEVGGRVREVSETFELGNRLPAGAILLRIERTTYQAELMRARGAVSGAEARLSQAETALSRQEELARNDFASEATIDELEANVAGAEGELAGARAALRVAEKQLEDTALTIPFDAIVTSEDVSPGQLLQAGQQIGEVVRADIAELRTSLPEREFRRFTPQGGMTGKEIEIVVPGEAEPVRRATITAVSPQIDGAARMVEIIARIEQPFAGDAPLLLNGLVEVRIPLPEVSGTVFSLPTAALQVGQRMWKLTAVNSLEPVEFTIERRTEDRVFFRSDSLTAEDRVLLTALQTQVEGRKVRTEEDTGEAGGL